MKIESLGTYAQLLRFLDYLLKHFVQAAMVAGDGVLVNDPDPARFALHKLIVSRRSTSFDALSVESGRPPDRPRQAAALAKHLS